MGKKYFHQVFFIFIKCEFFHFFFYSIDFIFVSVFLTTQSCAVGQNDLQHTNNINRYNFCVVSSVVNKWNHSNKHLFNLTAGTLLSLDCSDVHCGAWSVVYLGVSPSRAAAGRPWRLWGWVRSFHCWSKPSSTRRRSRIRLYDCRSTGARLALETSIFQKYSIRIFI